MDDLISRQALLEEYDRLHVGEPGRARKMIEDAPTVQPEPCGEMVSREVVVKFFDDWMSALDINCHHQSVADLRIIKGDIKNLPSSQPEIIRCAECKWFQCNMSMDGYLPKGVDEFECRHWCGSCDPVDFCSHAERREK